MKNTITARRADDVETERVLQWEETPEGEWEAWMVFYAPELNYRLYDLDAVDAAQLVATILQFTRGALPEVYLLPRHTNAHQPK